MTREEHHSAGISPFYHALANCQYKASSSTSTTLRIAVMSLKTAHTYPRNNVLVDAKESSALGACTQPMQRRPPRR
jgi:hypothetical protein